MSTTQLLNRWRDRQKEILETLSPDLLAEYRKLGELIETVEDEEDKNAREIKTSGQKTNKEHIVPANFFPPIPRVPLSVHKKKLIDYLKKHGPSTRGEISAGAAIPPGSLSELLSEKEFEQHERGFWGLRGQVKKPGTSANT
jgi:hypothetical protein